MAPLSEKITFDGAHGDALAARLDLPDGRPKAFALFAHCFTCSKDIFAASRIASGLTAHGIGVLRFDFTGLGSSDGEFANTNFSSNVDDLVAAADYLRHAHEAPKLLIGHSLGGAAVLAAAGKIKEAVAVATIGAPGDPAHVAHLFADSRQEIEAEGEAEVSLAGRPFRIKKQFLDDIASQKLESDVARMKKALIVFHSPVDDTVDIENAGTIFQAAKHPKSFVSLDDADHLLTQKADAAYVADVLAAWADRFIGGGAAEPVRLEITAAPGTVVVAETGVGTFANTISVGGRHSLRADEPESVGGTDTGPTPYDLLLAGLGACTTMTVRLYAERKGFPLERVAVTLKHDKIHAADCDECETREGKLDRIESEISFIGDLTDEQRSRMLEIAGKCPVHRTLHSEVHVVSRLAE